CAAGFHWGLIPARKKHASSISFICVNLCDLWAKNSYLIWVVGIARVRRLAQISNNHVGR
ncbi:hypothetical protein, partial [Desulfonatronospira sp.]|uniref:hypothetical protein n=1 Tax=Desulfonatronospira sp. TaxID=1962951 RepID=UPI0025C087FA